MHVEIQVALNFVISYLYNKLPRRRVNIFGEELEKALKLKFEGHWYPDKPFRGSAYRCLKSGTPCDPVLEIAATKSGMSLPDIRENLPCDLAVWVDPGEVSYRIGEKGAIKILYSENGDIQDDDDREVTKTFNPEAQCFRPIENVSTSLSNLGISPNPLTTQFTSPTPPMMTQTMYKSTSPELQPQHYTHQNRSMPLTFTTATFAQTKFGSTKLKTSSKRANRMSPTEFSNYIKQRAMLQDQQSQGFMNGGFITPQRPRSLSPNPSLEEYFSLTQPQSQLPFSRNGDSLQSFSALENQPSSKFLTESSSTVSTPWSTGSNALTSPDGINNKQLLESLNSVGINNINYSPSHYPQHLLMAN